MANPKLIKELDTVFSEYIRRNDSDSFGNIKCFCCGAVLNWKQSHNMHYISRKHMGTRFNEKNCHSGCFDCNVNLLGNIEAYERNLIKYYGENILSELAGIKNKITKFTDSDIRELIAFYKGKIRDLFNI